jgi:DNA-binding MarR family transcriptional regulator
MSPVRADASRDGEMDVRCKGGDGPVGSDGGNGRAPVDREPGGLTGAAAESEVGLTGAAAELAAAFKVAVRGMMRLRGRDTHLGGDDLSYAQLGLLIELYERGELPAGELAAAARLTPATVTQMLDHLAASGHVERLRSPSDKRVVVSRLTPEGRRLLVAKRRHWEQRWQSALQGVPDRDLRVATKVLQRLQTLYEDFDDS